MDGAARPVLGSSDNRGRSGNKDEFDSKRHLIFAATADVDGTNQQWLTEASAWLDVDDDIFHESNTAWFTRCPPF